VPVPVPVPVPVEVLGEWEVAVGYLKMTVSASDTTVVLVDR